jgi:hypothetical protein
MDDPHAVSTDPEVDVHLALVEIVASVSWFLMDASWMFRLPILAWIFAAPAGALSLLELKFAERRTPEIWVDASTACWTLMNICWMLEDTKVNTWGIECAGTFFSVGAICLVVAGIKGPSRMPVVLLLRRFRRVKAEK